MAKNRKNRKKRTIKTITPGIAPEDIAVAVSDAVAEALDPIREKLDSLIDQQEEDVKVDETTLDLVGVDTVEELGEIIAEGAALAADQLEDDGDPIAAAVIDSELNTGEILDELVKSRKSRKAAGEELEPITPEEVAEIIEVVAEEVADSLDEAELQDMVDDGLIDESDLDEAAPPNPQAKRRKKRTPRSAARSKKSAGAGRQTKRAAAATPLQRKYNNIYMSGSKSTEPKAEEKLAPEVKLARAVKCATIFSDDPDSRTFSDPERAAYAAKKYYGDSTMEREFKSMSATQPSSSGIFIPQDYLTEVIPMLYDATVLMELGAQVIPMPHGNINIYRQTSGARARFGGEARNVKPSNPTHDLLHLTSKRLEALIIQTNELMRSTTLSADQMFGNDLLMKMKGGIEYGGLLGKGTEFEPLGIIPNRDIELVNLLSVNDIQLADAQGRPTADLPIFLKGKVLKKNVMGTTFGWTMNSDAEQYFKRMKSTTGQFIWKEEMDKGFFNGDPYRASNILTTLPNGATSVVFGLWSDMLIGEQFGLETEMSNQATVVDDDGSVVNLYQSRQTATLATTYIDIGTRHNESFVKASNIKVVG